MTKCKICKYQKDCPGVVEENSIYCLAHRKIPKNFNNEYIEKQQLISFLEDNIRNRLNTVEFYENQDIQGTKEELEKTVSRLLAELNIYQEVLDFVEKGGKDE